MRTPRVLVGTSTFDCWWWAGPSGSVLPIRIRILQRGSIAPLVHHLIPLNTCASSPAAFIGRNEQRDGIGAEFTQPCWRGRVGGHCSSSRIHSGKGPSVGLKVSTYASNHVLMGHMNEPESFIVFLPEPHRIFMLLVLGWYGLIIGFVDGYQSPN